MRRAQYLNWLADEAALLVAEDSSRLLGYAMVRVIPAVGSWQWGSRAGVLETLVVSSTARGQRVGQTLLSAARDLLAASGIDVMTISVIAGNEGALRFYRREGATDYLTTLIMRVTSTSHHI